MEGLAPPMQLALEVIFAIESGESVKNGVRKFLVRHHGEFVDQVELWLAGLEQNQPLPLESLQSPYRRSLLFLLERGIAGNTIGCELARFVEELEFACSDELDRYFSLMPFRLLFPLLFFQFPAFLLLLFGPLLSELLTHMTLEGG